MKTKFGKKQENPSSLVSPGRNNEGKIQDEGRLVSFSKQLTGEYFQTGIRERRIQKAG